MSENGYLLENQTSGAADRLDALSELFDPSTFRHCTNLGIEFGWSCWEVGAGGSSVVNWLAQCVGPSGRVLATDIDVSWVSDGTLGPVEVRAHDVAIDSPPDEAFDLIHARLVLVHIADRQHALENMMSVLRPGGWILVEDADPALQPLSCPDVVGPDQELANKIRTGFRTLMSGRGVDLSYGRTLPRLLREIGLSEVGADAYFPVALPACERLEIATIHMIRDRLVENGIADDEEIELHLSNIAAGRLDLAQPPMISAWGKRN